MKYSTAYKRLLDMTINLMIEAMRVGRYPGPHSAAAYMTRDKSKAFTCIAYQRLIREIAAMDLALLEVRCEAVRLGEMGINA